MTEGDTEKWLESESGYLYHFHIFVDNKFKIYDASEIVSLEESIRYKNDIKDVQCIIQKRVLGKFNL